MCTHTKFVEDEKNFKANNQCLQPKSNSVIYCLGLWPWSAPSLTTLLAVVSNQSAHFHPSSPHCSVWQRDLAMSAFAKTPKGRGKNRVQRKKKKTKCKLICLAEPHWILSWIQRISVPVIRKYINQVITIGTVIKLQTVLKVQKACGANRHDDSRAREEGDIKIRYWKKNSKWLPNFTLDYCFTAENSTQTSELPAQDFKHTTIFPLRETMTAPNKAL